MLKGNGIRRVTLPDRQVILSIWVVILIFFWPLRAFFEAIALAIGLSIMAKIITLLEMDWLDTVVHRGLPPNVRRLRLNIRVGKPCSEYWGSIVAASQRI